MNPDVWAHPAVAYVGLPFFMMLDMQITTRLRCESRIAFSKSPGIWISKNYVKSRSRLLERLRHIHARASRRVDVLLMQDSSKSFAFMFDIRIFDKHGEVWIRNAFWQCSHESDHDPDRERRQWTSRASRCQWLPSRHRRSRHAAIQACTSWPYHPDPTAFTWSCRPAQLEHVQEASHPTHHLLDSTTAGLWLSNRRCHTSATSCDLAYESGYGQSKSSRQCFHAGRWRRLCRCT